MFGTQAVRAAAVNTTTMLSSTPLQKRVGHVFVHMSEGEAEVASGSEEAGRSLGWVRFEYEDAVRVTSVWPTVGSVRGGGMVLGVGGVSVGYYPGYMAPPDI